MYFLLICANRIVFFNDLHYVITFFSLNLQRLASICSGILLYFFS